MKFGFQQILGFYIICFLRSIHNINIAELKFKRSGDVIERRIFHLTISKFGTMSGINDTRFAPFLVRFYTYCMSTFIQR